MQRRLLLYGFAILTIGMVLGVVTGAVFKVPKIPERSLRLRLPLSPPHAYSRLGFGSSLSRTEGFGWGRSGG